MARLYTPHALSLQTAYSDLKRQAGEQSRILNGTPGTIVERIVRGRSFLYRQFYDPTDRKAADYLGPAGDAAAEARATELREQIATTNALLSTARLLGRAGYVRVDARADAVLAALADNGLFRAGALLVGSHAYGTLLNELGVRAAGYATEDIDVARDRPLVGLAPKSFEEMLSDARLDLRPVPRFDRKPSTSFKLPGASRLRVDLLVPTGGRTVKVLETPDLRAHATALPDFRYLLEGPIEGVVLGRSAVVPVRVPKPERLAWHKLVVSETRHDTSDKKAKDVEQAAVLIAVLAEREPAGLEEAFRDLSSSARTKAKRAARKLVGRLEETGNERGAELIRELAG